MLLLVVFLLRYLYAELYRATFLYGTEGLRLVISRGAFLRQKGSLPLLPVTEIYVKRNLIDIICGLCNVDVYTPMDTTRKFARIEALNPQDAESLQTFLGQVLTTQVFLAPDANKDEPEEDAAVAKAELFAPRPRELLALPRH